MQCAYKFINMLILQNKIFRLKSRHSLHSYILLHLMSRLLNGWDSKQTAVGLGKVAAEFGCAFTELFREMLKLSVKTSAILSAHSLGTLSLCCLVQQTSTGWLCVKFFSRWPCLEAASEVLVYFPICLVYNEKNHISKLQAFSVDEKLLTFKHKIFFWLWGNKTWIMPRGAFGRALYAHLLPYSYWLTYKSCPQILNFYFLGFTRLFLTMQTRLHNVIAAYLSVFFLALIFLFYQISKMPFWHVLCILRYFFPTKKMVTVACP